MQTTITTDCTDQGTKKAAGFPLDGRLARVLSGIFVVVGRVTRTEASKASEVEEEEAEEEEVVEEGGQECRV